MKLTSTHIDLYEMPTDAAEWVSDVWWDKNHKDRAPAPTSVNDVAKYMAWRFMWHRKHWLYGTHAIATRYIAWLLSKEDAYTLETNKKGKTYRWIKPEYFWHIRKLLSITNLKLEKTNG